MADRTKQELKAFFETGDLPTESNFSDLIDNTFSADLEVSLARNSILLGAGVLVNEDETPGFLTATNSVTIPPAGPNENSAVSKYFSVIPGEELSYSGRYGASAIGIIFFDSAGAIISSTSQGSSGQVDEVVVVPANAVKARASDLDGNLLISLLKDADGNEILSNDDLNAKIVKVDNILNDSVSTEYNRLDLAVQGATRNRIYAITTNFTDVAYINNIKVKVGSQTQNLNAFAVKIGKINKVTNLVTYMDSDYRIFSGLSVGDVVDIEGLELVLDVDEYLFVATNSSSSMGYSTSGGEGYVVYNEAGNTVSQGDTLSILNSNFLLNVGIAFNYFTRQDVAALGNASNPIFRKTMNVLGDSLTGNTIEGELNMWPAIIADRNQMAVNNYGIGGSTLAVGGGNPMVNRYAAMEDGVDYIIVWGGTNDEDNNIPIGLTSSTNTSEFSGALNDICDGLLTKYPTARIGFITMMREPGGEPYAQAVKDVCALYSIPVLDLYKKNGIGFGNVAREAALTRSNDGTHPNAEGHKFISTKIEAFIKSL